MKGNPIRGGRYLLQGFSMMTEPGLRAFVLIPLLINTLLFTLAIALLMSQFSGWVDYWMSFLPEWGWLDFIRGFFWLIFAVLVLATVYFSFSIVANFIAAPFNGILAEKVEQRLRGELEPEATGWKALIASIPHSLQRELAKMAYYLPRLLILLIITFIPVINLAAPFLWFLFGAWMMAIQYCDYPMDNNRVSFKQMHGYLKQQRFSSLGFGALVSLGLLVPVLNLLIMPAAVVGATVYWVRDFAEPESSNSSPSIQL